MKIMAIAGISLLFIAACFAAFAKMNNKRVGLVIGTMMFSVLLLFTAAGNGPFIFYPPIDTKYAPGFSERAFSKVRIGMTEEEVFSLLGSPLQTGPADKRDVRRWSYTQDGKCSWGDWAWFVREIDFLSGSVVAKRALMDWD